MYSYIKRVLDVTLSTILILVLSPIFIIIMILLKVTSKDPVFYKQDRVGFKNNIFRIWKFTTMIDGSEKIGTGGITLRDDPRVTMIGKLLRITKLNELPQIINVLKGNMSIVGPRPLMQEGFDGYELKYKKMLYNIKPGITGIGSIILRDEEKLLSASDLPPHEYYEKVILPYKGELEYWYQKNITLRMDLIIILLTVLVVIFPNSNLPYKIFKTIPSKPKLLNCIN